MPRHKGQALHETNSNLLISCDAGIIHILY